MKKFMWQLGIFLTGFVAATALVQEIRTSRRLNCFNCASVKCILNEIDHNPKLLVTHPAELAEALGDASGWD